VLDELLQFLGDLLLLGVCQDESLIHVFPELVQSLLLLLTQIGLLPGLLEHELAHPTPVLALALLLSLQLLEPLRLAYHLTILNTGLVVNHLARLNPFLWLLGD